MAQVRMLRMLSLTPTTHVSRMAARSPCRLSNAVTSQIIKEPETDLNVGPAYLLVRAIIQSWWVWEDSNHRPRPYQGRALTT